MLRKTKRSTPKQSGQAAIELVMSLLLFVMMVGTLLSLSLYMYVHHSFLTAAKEGARAAAVEASLANAGTRQTGVNNVADTVVDFVSGSTGITLNRNSNVTVTGPTGATVGDRTVTVTVNYAFDNPIQIRTFMNRLSGGSAEDLDKLTISHTATMRYEE